MARSGQNPSPGTGQNSVSSFGISHSPVYTFAHASTRNTIMIREERTTCQEHFFCKNFSDLVALMPFNDMNTITKTRTREELYESHGKHIRQGRVEIHSAV